MEQSPESIDKKSSQHRAELHTKDLLCLEEVEHKDAITSTGDVKKKRRKWDNRKRQHRHKGRRGLRT